MQALVTIGTFSVCVCANVLVVACLLKYSFLRCWRRGNRKKYELSNLGIGSKQKHQFKNSHSNSLPHKNTFVDTPGVCCHNLGAFDWELGEKDDIGKEKSLCLTLFLTFWQVGCISISMAQGSIPCRGRDTWYGSGMTSQMEASSQRT